RRGRRSIRGRVCGAGRRDRLGERTVKLRVSVVLSRGAVRDVVLACDVTTTVADIARALVRAGVSADPRLDGAAQHRLAPVTLRVASDHSARPTQLDPMAPVASSG